MSARKVNRRKFLALAGATGVGLGVAAACSPSPAPTATAALSLAQGTPTADEMDEHHKQGVLEFVGKLEANNKIFWSPKLPFKMDGDVKVFEIACKEVAWEVRPGEKIKAMTYNGITPGPEIRMTEGDKVRFNVKNEMSESTAIHWHGVHTPNKMDGVPFVTQDPIKPGGTFTYEFVAKPVGSHMYHSHHNAAEQVTKGLLGAFIVEPKDKSKEPKFDSDYTIVLNDANVGLTLNGKSFPATGAILAKLGERVRVRFMNEGWVIHPMHLHGYYMQVFAQDGYLLPQPYNVDTLNIAPGSRYDVLIETNEPGVWAFHCHILTHAESPHGMFGMVMALIVQ